MKGVHRSKIVVLVLVLLLGVMPWTGLYAASSKEGVPVRIFEAMGIMSYVDIPTGTVFIDKKRFKLSPNAIWYGLDPKQTLSQQLHRIVNKPVGYAIDSKRRAASLKAIWVIPSEGR